MLKDFGYIVEPTGADSPSQNRGAKIYNRTLVVKVRTLLYGSGLPANFWLAALLLAVYLHNQLVHSAMSKTPYKGWHGGKSDISHLKTFGYQVCIKQSGSQRCKLDRHDFTGIFLGYTATDQKTSTMIQCPESSSPATTQSMMKHVSFRTMAPQGVTINKLFLSFSLVKLWFSF
jgi:hypothetical protein